MGFLASRGAANGMMLQATIEVPTARGKGKENEFMGSKGTGQFILFVCQTVNSSGPIPIRSLSGPFGRTGLEP